MILFFNVLVTDRRASVGGLNRFDRLDIFKYALYSFSKIGLTDVIIYCQLEGAYLAREQELKDFIYKTFCGGCKISYSSHSPANQAEWQAMLKNSPLLTTDKPIIYSGNDDHIFIDYDTEVFYEGVDLFNSEPADQINTIHISSWTEAISTVYGLNDFDTVGRYWTTELLYSDAIQVVNSTFFKHIFFDLNMGNDYMRRTDNFLTNWYPYLGNFAYPSSVPHPKVKTFIPLREQVRHFDSYWHIGVSDDDCPKLEIPTGFKIKEEEPAIYNLAHRKAILAPHNREYQRPGVRAPAVRTVKYRDFGNGVLPLPEKYVTAGYR